MQLLHDDERARVVVSLDTPSGRSDADRQRAGERDVVLSVQPPELETCVSGDLLPLGARPFELLEVDGCHRHQPAELEFAEPGDQFGFTGGDIRLSPTMKRPNPEAGPRSLLSVDDQSG